MRRHVVLLTYGEPPAAAFLSQLRYSWRILLGLTRSVAPIPPALLPMIALARARSRWTMWRQERYGSPLEPPRPMETGRLATERICSGIADRLKARFGIIRNGWLNHVYGGRWTEPPADEALKQIAEAGFRRVVYFPFGFSADNAETE